MGYDEAELIFAGDAMQHSAQLDAARRPGGSYDYSGCFRFHRTFAEHGRLRGGES